MKKILFYLGIVLLLMGGSVIDYGRLYMRTFISRNGNQFPGILYDSATNITFMVLVIVLARIAFREKFSLTSGVILFVFGLLFTFFPIFPFSPIYHDLPQKIKDYTDRVGLYTGLSGAFLICVGIINIYTSFTKKV